MRYMFNQIEMHGTQLIVWTMRLWPMSLRVLPLPTPRASVMLYYVLKCRAGIDAK